MVAEKINERKSETKKLLKKQPKIQNSHRFAIKLEKLKRRKEERELFQLKLEEEEEIKRSQIGKRVCVFSTIMNPNSV